MTSQLPLDVTGVLSVCFEVLLYGVYCTLFFESVYVILKKKQTKTFPAKVFFGVTLVMFAVATTHIAVNLYRLLRGYVWLAGSPGPVVYFDDLGRWENIAHDAINAVMTWLGDFLLIYRCFIVWNNNYYIIVIPTVLLIFSVVTNSVALHLFTEVRLGTLFSPALVHWMDTIYALALVQNTITTGLIAYRIWRQDRVSLAIGLHSSGSKSSLMPIVRIVVESAVIYVLTAVVIIILYALDNNFQFIVQEAIVPIIGIVFTLISVRLAMRNAKILATTARDGVTIEWNVTRNTNVHTVDMAEGTIPTNGTSDISMKSTEFITPLEGVLTDPSGSEHETK